MTASEASRHSLDLNANALTVLERRYLVKDDHGKPWSVPRPVLAGGADHRGSGSDLWRLGSAVEGLAETFFELMAARVWMPNSPT